MKIVKSRAIVGCCAAAIGALAVSPLHASVIHRYSFTTDASDSVGSSNGTLFNTATVSGGLLNFNNPNFSGNTSGQPSTHGYLSLPASILPASGSATIEEWFTITGSGFFAESYTFTNATDAAPPTGVGGQYFMHTISAPQPATPPGGPNTGGSHIVQSLNGFNPGPETDAFGTTPNVGAGGGGYLDDGETFMSATVIDGAAGTLSYYLFDISQGGIGGLQQTVTTVPLSSFAFTSAYLGKSAFSGDDSTSGSMDEFRIFDDAQSAAAIAANFAAGPSDTNILVAAVPEPVSFSLLGLGALGLLMRRPSRRGSAN